MNSPIGAAPMDTADVATGRTAPSARDLGRLAGLDDLAQACAAALEVFVARGREESAAS